MDIHSVCVCKNPDKVFKQNGCPQCWLCAKCGNKGCDDPGYHLKENQDLETNKMARKNSERTENNRGLYEKFDADGGAIYSTDD